MNSSKLFLYIFSFFILSYVQATDTPRILIKIPTRERSAQFFTTLDEFYAKLSYELPYHFVISCDIDDLVMNSPGVILTLNTYPNLSLYFSNNKSKIEAINKDINKHLDFDIVIVAADDFMPLIQNYDLIIASAMNTHFPNYDGILHFNDGIQGPNLNTLPIYGKKFYEKFGYIYYPGYKSLYCDTELTDVSRMLNKVVYVDLLLIEHQHPCTGKHEYDDLYIRNDRHFEHDKDLYFKRRQINFGLKSREIINPLH